MIFNEVYDVVDKDGNKIGTATWTECHSKGFLHQTVHGLVFRDITKRHILIKKRHFKMVQEPGVWEIAVSGHIISGNTPEEGILQELQEELFEGRKIPKDIVVTKITNYFHNDLPNNNELAHLFEIICAGPFSPSAYEIHQKPKWIHVRDLYREITAAPHKWAKYAINSLNEYKALRRISSYP